MFENPQKRVLVLDGESRSALAVSRSLGAIGLEVGVASDQVRAIAKRSKFSKRAFLSPNPLDDASEYRNWLADAIAFWRPTMVFPCSDISLASSLDVFQEIETKAILPSISREQFELVSHKANLLSVARELGIDSPKSLLFTPTNAPEEELKSFSYPAVLKPNRTATLLSGNWHKAPSYYLENLSELQSTLEELRGGEFSDLEFLLQERVYGEGVGVFALYAHGRLLSTFAHRRLLEKPPSGGVSVLSEALPLEQAPTKDALRLLEHLTWNGVAMVEFKQRADDPSRYSLIEINSRFWGSTQLAISSGRDFPAQTFEAFSKGEMAFEKEDEPYRCDTRLRWLLGTLDNFLIRLKENPLKTICAPRLQLLKSGMRTKHDVFCRSDLGPFFSELRAYLFRKRKKERREPQRILLYIESAGPGGAERVVLQLAELLKRQKKEVLVLTHRYGWLVESLHEQGIGHRQISSQKSFDFSLPFRIAKLLREEKIDLVHSHLLDSNFYGALAARIAGIPQLSTEHGDAHHIKKKRFFSLKLRLISLFSDMIAAVSEYSQKALRENGVSPEKISVVGNPVDLEAKDDSPSREALRSSLGVDQDPSKEWLWLHVGNFRPVKDQESLLIAFATACQKSKHPQRLAIVGDGDLRASLEDVASEWEISERVSFLGFQDDVAPWYRAADGFILSSRSEAMPMVVLEAGLAGLVVVSTNVGGISEVVSDGHSGHLAEVGSTEELGRALVCGIDNYLQGNDTGATLRSQVKETFTPEKVLGRYLQIYRALSR